MPDRDTPWPTGTPCWVDLGTPDVPAAREFYRSVLGWTFGGGDGEPDGYTMGRIDGRDAAGLGPMEGPAGEPRWTTYFATDDVDAVAGRVTAAGGTVQAGPMDIGPAGRLAFVADPQGNPFGLWQAGTTTGVQVYNQPGALIWNEAAVEEPAAARDFYTAVFGFSWEEMPDSGGYSVFATADRPLGGLGGLAPGVPRGWTACFAVADTDATVAAVEAGGGKVLVAAEDSPYGRFAIVADPWGASFSVMAGMDEVAD